MDSATQPLPVIDTIQRAIRRHQNGELEQAEALYREVLQLEPNNADALHLLGVIANQRGQNEIAVDLIEKAIKVNQAVPFYHYNAGNAYSALNKFEEAVACYQRALLLNPDYYEALNNLGNALKGQGKLEEAITCYQRVLSLNPDYYEAFNNLGNALKDQGKLEEAMACHQRAIALKPDFYKAHTNLGVVLHDQGKMEEAIACYQHALTLNPDYYEALINLGNALREQGKFKEAMASYRKAISVNENYTEVYLYLTECRKFTEADNEFIETLREMVEREDIKDEDSANLRFALGKVYDDLGRFGEAFSNYHEANRIENKKCKFDREKHYVHISRLIETFTPEFFGQRRNFGSDADLPIMVLGMPRSGTTLVEQIVASHPHVHGAGELEFWNDTERKRRCTLYNISAMKGDIAASIAVEYIDYLRSFSKTARHITDKMPNNYQHIWLIHLVFPKVRIIHVQRNPVDTCLSIYFQKFRNHPYSYDLDNLVFYYKQYRRLMSHWRNVLPSEVFHEVNYEDLIKDQENVIRELIRFCRLPWDEKCLRFNLTERPVKTASKWQVRQPIYKNSMARWKNYEPFLGPLSELLTEN